jgi:GNAT superfamily N-acetyltransferase
MPTPTIALAQPSEEDIDVIHAFLVTSYWSPGIPRDTVARSLAHSICAIARDEAGALVGFARLITDRATFAYVCDVFVLGEHQGKGLARAMIRLFLDHPELQGFKRWMLGTRDAHGVYAGVGFKPIAAPERFMEIRNYNPYGEGAG